MDEVQIQIIQEVRGRVVAVRIPNQGRPVAQAQIGPLKIQTHQGFDFFDDSKTVLFGQATRRGTVHLVHVVIPANAQPVVDMERRRGGGRPGGSRQRQQYTRHYQNLDLFHISIPL